MIGCSKENFRISKPFCFLLSIIYRNSKNLPFLNLRVGINEIQVSSFGVIKGVIKVYYLLRHIWSVVSKPPEEEGKSKITNMGVTNLWHFCTRFKNCKYWAHVATFPEIHKSASKIAWLTQTFSSRLTLKR